MNQRLFGTIFAVLSVLFFVLSTLRPIGETISVQADADTNSDKTIAAMQNMDFIEYKPLNFAQMKAMWFAFFDYTDMLCGKAKQEFEDEVYQRFINAKDLGINTLFVHVRSHGDAYYPSQYFPYSSRCMGTIGQAPDFDPLEIMVDIAHELDLSFHAWVNPLRLMTVEQISLLSNDCILKQWYNNPQYKGKYIVEFDGLLYLNPAYDEVRNLVCDGIDEIISNYNVDGVHIDDYFYPTADASFDSIAFEQSGAEKLDTWRFENTNTLVNGIYTTVKNHDSRLQFGISPAAADSVNMGVYADVNHWIECGLCDYIVPQIYFEYTNETNPFEAVLQNWKQKTENSDVNLVIGICTYKYASDKAEWSDDTLSMRQCSQILNDEALSGVAIYSYSATFLPEQDAELYARVRDNIKSVLYKEG